MHRITTLFTCLTLALLLALTPAARADVKLPSIIGSNMVLQQGVPTKIFGWDKPGQEVSVSFAGHVKKAEALKDGSWQVVLPVLEASATNRAMTIRGSSEVVLKNILVGEVWICSGQSNMEWSVARSANPNEEIAAAKHPNIRLFNVTRHITAHKPQDNAPGSWAPTTPESVRNFSAVGFYFGRKLHKDLGVPIGLVGSNWGGTRIEPWTTEPGFASVPELKAELDQIRKIWSTPDMKINHRMPGTIGNAMIHPLAPFVMRGAIWYQGESNGNEGMTYYHKKKALVNGWRKLFNKDLAFYWVQLADFRQPNDNPAGGDGWARIREAQRLAAKDIPHTGMAVIIDIGNATDIHPKNKQDVGKRLAHYALHQTYKKKDVVAAGPLYKGHKVEGNAIRISFEHTGSGLMVGKKVGLEPTQTVKDGKLARFAIAGEDKQWHWADATIDGNTVVVKSSAVAKPVAVRYAYSMNPKGANLYNKDGLPASPFRTDDW